MVLDAILPIVTRCSSLSLGLYQVAAGSQATAKQLIDTAKVANAFALNLKQVGTLITENDQLPSHVALGSLETVIRQAGSVLRAIESAIEVDNGVLGDRLVDPGLTDCLFEVPLEYLTAHLEALRCTLSLMLQTLFTAQSIMWSKCRPTISPQQGAKAVRNERLQLEALVVDQQMSLLYASKTFEGSLQTNRLLMETDSSMSLISNQEREREGPSPADLHQYQERYIASLGIDGSNEASWLPAVSGIKSSQADRLLQVWTSLPQFETRLQEAQREAQKQRQETQQPTVESDSEDEYDAQSSTTDSRAGRGNQRSGSVQPLFAELGVEESYGPAALPPPAATPRHSRDDVHPLSQENASPVTPRSSIGSIPVEAAAAMEAKEEDDVDLEIPWTLCTRKYYWKYIDAKQVSSNTDQNSSIAFLERHSWTEITASWVCMEALQEAGFKFTQVQKDRRDGRRTRFETCFCIEKPLQFDQVKRLVERTVELYRRTAPPTPPPSHTRRSSYQRPPPLNVTKANFAEDRSRTPVPRSTHPPLNRSNSKMTLPPPPGPPPLDRSVSMPGPEYFPPPQLPPRYQASQISRSSNLQIPMSPGYYPPQNHPRSRSPHLHQYSQHSNGYPTQPTYPPSPQSSHSPQGQLSGSLPQHVQFNSFTVPQSPLRQSYMSASSNSRYDDRDLTTSDSDSAGRERSRKHRSKSRSRYAPERKKKSGKASKAVGALMGVGGLTALLDGLSGI